MQKKSTGQTIHPQISTDHDMTFVCSSSSTTFASSWNILTDNVTFEWFFWISSVFHKTTGYSSVRTWNHNKISRICLESAISWNSWYLFHVKYFGYLSHSYMDFLDLHSKFRSRTTFYYKLWQTHRILCSFS